MLKVPTVRAFTLLPLSSHTVCCPATPSRFLCCPYLLISRVLCWTDLSFRHVKFMRPTPAARRGLLLRFQLRHFKFMRPTPAARRGLLLLLLLFIIHLISMLSRRNVDLYTADEYGDLLYDGIDKTVHGAPQLLRLILDEPTLRGRHSTIIQQPLRPASHTISASDINTVKCCGDGDCGWHSLLNGRNRHFGQVCIHIRYIPFITTVTNSYLPVCVKRLYYIRPSVQQYPHLSSSPYHSADNAYRIACYIPPFVEQYSADFPCLLLLTLRHPDSFTTARCAILPLHYLYNNPTRHSYPSPPSTVIQQSAHLLKVPPSPPICTPVLCTLLISSSSLHHSTVKTHRIACYIPPFVRQYSACSLHGSYRLLLPSIRTAVLSRTATLT